MLAQSAHVRACPVGCSRRISADGTPTAAARSVPQVGADAGHHGVRWRLRDRAEDPSRRRRRSQVARRRGLRGGARRVELSTGHHRDESAHDDRVPVRRRARGCRRGGGVSRAERRAHGRVWCCVWPPAPSPRACGRLGRDGRGHGRRRRRRDCRHAPSRQGKRRLASQCPLRRSSFSTR